jgi:NADH dehydrogenase
MEPFEYNDKGSATIGRNKAVVVDLPNYHFSGVFAVLFGCLCIYSR